MRRGWSGGVAMGDLPESYREMARVIGIKATLRLAEHYRKQSFYFKGLDDLIAKKKAEYVLRNFDGANHQSLARATGYSLRWVYRILDRDMGNTGKSLFGGRR